MRKALFILGVLAAAAVAASSPATAAEPHKHARYIGFEGSETDMDLTAVSAKARVTGSGRRFRRRSYVSLQFNCGRDRNGEFQRRLPLTGVRIRGDGRFSARKLLGRVRYRLRGRFVMRDYAKITYRASSPPRRPRDSSRPGRCQSGRSRVALYERGLPPFKGCGSQPAKTDLRNGDGRVFEQLRLERSGEFFPHAYACLFSVNKRFRLSRNWDEEAFEEPRLATPYVAFVRRFCGGAGGCTPFIEVRDLRDGRWLRNLEASVETVAGRGRVVTDLELKANGSIAWIVDRAALPGVGLPRTIDVVAVDSTGRRLLDSGTGVEPKSLRLTGSTLTWRKGGVPRSATLN